MDVYSLMKQVAALWVNLSAGVRLATGRRVSRRDFIYSLDQGLLLLLLVLLLEFAVGYLDAEPPVAYNSYGISYLSAAYFADFVILLLIARLASADLGQTASLLLANLAVTPLVLLVSHLSTVVIDAQPPSLWSGLGAIFLLLGWQFFIVIRLLQLYLPLKRIRAGLLAGLNIGLLFAVTLVLPQTDLWYTDADTKADNPYAAMWKMNVEDVFYSQAPMMDDTLSAVADHRPGITDLYLVTFAGYGYEKVFLNEVEYVRKLFDRKFDTENRSLVLANNMKTLEQYPLANRHNLSDALGAIGKRIDPEEDIVFLFMTSHGSKDHKFSVDFGPIKLENLTPQQVKKALDDAGIRWRVVLVSSCYSGGFIEPLQDPNTLVITAAAGDRQSFGCGAKSEFTDFGDAYFKKALAQRSDFIEAFDIAAKLVKEEELRQRRTASNPQISIGGAIRPKLAALFDELAVAEQMRSGQKLGQMQ